MTDTAPTHGAVLDADGWITHDGGPNPVPGQRVDVRYRGSEGERGPSDGFSWSRTGGFFDIIAYRLARPTPEGEATPSITATMESETGPDVSKRAKALSELAALDGETMDLPTVSDGRGGRRPINPEDDR